MRDRLSPKTTTVRLYRPVGCYEWEKIEALGRRAFPPRLHFQPIFYPVLVLSYARKIARDWNTVDPQSGYLGIVTEFQVLQEVASRYPEQIVGDESCRELWVSAEELAEFNEAIVGKIKIVEVYCGERYVGEPPEPDPGGTG